ncbi:hypothetical protein B0H11DRAFT_1917982 [Mycena galericulata]|nr:hypothetical protein B0H11DRAFT_1917982 [Mycena galericulata]
MTPQRDGILRCGFVWQGYRRQTHATLFPPPPCKIHSELSKASLCPRLRGHVDAGLVAACSASSAWRLAPLSRSVVVTPASGAWRRVGLVAACSTSITPSNAPTAARASPLDAREAIQEFSSPSPSPSSSMIRRVNKPPVHPPSTPVRRFKTWARVAVAVALLLARYAELDKVSVFVFIFASVTPSNAPTAARASPLDAREAIQEFSSPSPSPCSSMIRRVNKPPVHPPSTPVRRFKTWARVAVAVALLLARYADLDKQPVHPPSTPVRRFKTSEPVAVAVAFLFRWYADFDKQPVHPPPDAREVIQDFGSRRRRRRIALSMIRRVNKPLPQQATACLEGIRVGCTSQVAADRLLFWFRSGLPIGQDIGPHLRPFWGPAISRMVSSDKPHEWTMEDKLQAWGIYSALPKKKVVWTLHDKLNIPKCLDSEKCSICREYLEHLEGARGRGGRRQKSDDSEDAGSDNSDDSEDAGSDNSDDSEDVGSDMDEEDDGEGEDMDIGDSPMDSLFSLQDLIGKYRHLKSKEPVDASVVTAMVSRVKVEAEMGAADALQLALSAQLESVQLGADKSLSHLNELTLEHGRVLAERDQARSALADVEIKLASTLAAFKEVEERLHVAQIQLAAHPTQGQQLPALIQAETTPRRAKKRSGSNETARPTKRARGNETTRPTKCARGNETTSPAAPPAALDPVIAEWERFNQMTRPVCSDPPELIAQFLQYHEETNFRGIPLYGPAYTVDLRDVRGYRQVMGRAPPKRRSSEGDYTAECITRVLQILAIPGKYARLLQKANIVVAPEEDLSPCPWGTSPADLPDADVARLLVQSGLTTLVADDSWQFCRNFIQSQINAPDKAFNVAAMNEILKGMEKCPDPPRLRPLHVDTFRSTVPKKRIRGSKKKQQ